MTRASDIAYQAAAVICLHSSASSPRQWAALAQTLGAVYRVAAPELIDYGEACGWHYERPLTLEDEAQRIEPLIESEPDGVHLVGHSYGGAVALELALRNPGRVRSVALYEPVLFSLLNDGTAERPGRSTVKTEIDEVRFAIRRSLHAGRAAFAARLFVEYWSGPGAWESLDARRQAAITARMRKVDAEFDAVNFGMASLTDYRAVRVPVLLLVGGSTRRPARRIAELLGSVLPGSTRECVRNAGHMGPISHATEVNARIAAFLDAQSGYDHLARAA
ncbi:MAG TPA: alpha/beta hydrolase [Burkholderiales bacterium]